MVKILKIAIQNCNDVKQLFTEFKKHTLSLGYNNFALYVWDTDNIDNICSYNSMKVEPCGKTIGKFNNRKLICGENDYLCPDCSKKKIN
jgi:hypothetical protein